MAGKKKARGRPVKYPLPEPIDATPEEVARVVLQVKPKTEWRFEKEAGRDQESDPA